jgi:16S rRNA (cytosine1402-N4)-methyltransferase
LLEETIENLNIKPDGIYMDGTLGGAGHSLEIVRRLGENGRLIGIDQDEDAIKTATKRLEEYKSKVTIVRDNYCNYRSVLDELNILSVDGILLDLGVSSYQLDNADRGFTYRVDAPLDMRMDNRKNMTARDIVNDYTEEELSRILWEYGEEKYARSIARHIVAYRARKTIDTTEELNDIIRGSIPAKARNAKGHPSKQTFQALRIELNSELDVLKDSIDGMIASLNPGGRICILTFHSLEDRIVKNLFRKNENPCVCPPSFPVCTCGKKSLGRVVTRKPIISSEEELLDNSRAKSAKLRVFERISD